MQEELAGERMITGMESVALASSQSEEIDSSVNTSRNVNVNLDYASLADNDVQVEIPAADITKGYRLINLECLSETLMTVHKCPTGGLTVIDDNNNNGLFALNVVKNH